MITPAFAGQYYRDTATGNIWKANSTTPGDWTLLVQDVGLSTIPNDLSLFNKIPFVTYDTSGSTSFNSGATSLILSKITVCDAYIIISDGNIQTISFPELTKITYLESNTARALWIEGCTNLDTLLLPKLAQTDSGGLYIVGDSKLSSISLPLFVSNGDRVYITYHSQLTTFNAPNWIPSGSYNLNFNNNALNAASVNHILARCIANAAFINRFVYLNDGTNAAPTGQGILDAAALTARGCTILTN